jgi:thermostable 8-oxoguanine DNA glycosylase
MDAKIAGKVLAAHIVTHSDDYFVTSSMGESLVLAARFIAQHGANCLFNSGTVQEYREFLVRHFRGLGDKTASFAILLAYPHDCDIAIVDRWVLGWLNFRPVKKDGTLRKRNDPTHKEYLVLEARVRACFEASQANGHTPDDISLGIFHWCVWDTVRGAANPHWELCCR